MLCEAGDWRPRYSSGYHGSMLLGSTCSMEMCTFIVAFSWVPRDVPNKLLHFWVKEHSRENLDRELFFMILGIVMGLSVFNDPVGTLLIGFSNWHAIAAVTRKRDSSPCVVAVYFTLDSCV